MRIRRDRRLRAYLAIGLVDQETLLAGLAKRGQPEIEECLLCTIVPGSDLENLGRLVGCRHFASEFVGKANHLLDLLDGCHALSLFSPDIVLDANPDMRSNSHRD